MIDDNNIFNDDFNLTEDFGLSDKELAIAELYRGGSKQFNGNKKRCYMIMHPKALERTAEKRASELFKKPQVKRYLKIKGMELAKRADINADTLVADAQRLKDLCFGDEAYEEIEIDEEGKEVKISRQRFDATGVKNAIDLQGKLLNIYKDKTELTGKDGAPLLPTSIDVVYVDAEVKVRKREG